MFTGIVEETGRVLSFAKGDSGVWRLRLHAPMVAQTLALGDSLANNGCCLTVVSNNGAGELEFDLLEESVRLTSFGQVKPGDLINLERSLASDGRLGGHFVTGHVDTSAEIVVLEPRGANTYLQIRVPEPFRQYVVYKGCIAIDGMSLTIAEAGEDTLSVWIIPHTLEVTNLSQKKAGDSVNLEFDLLAKYVERMMATRKV